MTINPVDEPYAAAAWLVGRHRTLSRLINRLDAWSGSDDYSAIPDVDAVALAVNDYDRHTVEWAQYEAQHRPPRGDDAAYEAWRNAGPAPTDRAAVFGPMSGGEKRYLRMLAVLSPGTRVRFHLGDTDGVDQAYVDDWRQLVAGKVAAQ